MKRSTRLILTGTALVLLHCQAGASVTFALSNAAGGTPWSDSEASSPSALISDAFTYNPDLPNASTPIQEWDSNPDRAAFYLSIGLDTENFWTASLSIPPDGALTFLDLWGRTDYADGEQVRHQDLVITLSDGVNSWSGEAWNGVSESFENPSSYGRFDFTTAGVTGGLLTSATSIRIDHSPGSEEFLLLAEIRAGGLIPEPSALLLGAIGALASASRRHRRN